MTKAVDSLGREIGCVRELARLWSLVCIIPCPSLCLPLTLCVHSVLPHVVAPFLHHPQVCRWRTKSPRHERLQAPSQALQQLRGACEA